MSANQIRSHLEDVLRFMQPYWEFVNCHMVNYLTEKHWSRFIPAELRIEVPDAESARHCVDDVFWGNGSEFQFPLFKHFILSCSQYRLENCEELLTSLKHLNKLLEKEENWYEATSIKEFLSEKKKHEVELTAELVDRLIRSITSKNCSEIMIVDAGDGKGYLSSRLALQYRYKVVGIDFKESNTENALERNRKLQRSWKGLVKRAEIQNKAKPSTVRVERQTATKDINDELTPSSDYGSYKTVSKFITPDLDILQILRANFPTVNEFSTVCLTGLHTCGNLAATCLKMFHKQSQCKIICNIGCCYHLLQELYIDKEYFENSTLPTNNLTEGFPMSQFLRKKRFKLGRNARMLSSQSLERTLSEKRMMNISLFYRALLEVLICDSSDETFKMVQVGKIRNFDSFEDYVALCQGKLALKKDLWSSQRISEIQEQHTADKNYMHLFYLVRMSFAPVIESIILLDRLLYLKELNYEDSYLVPIFDAIKSPRRFGVIAVKA